MKRINYILLLLISVMLLNFTGCAVQAKACDLMEGITPSDNSFADFDGTDYYGIAKEKMAKLFNKSYTSGENVLISPLSIFYALGMTTNGAVGDTKTELEQALFGDEIEKINPMFSLLNNNFKNDSFGNISIANSIWYRNNKDRFQIKEDFLQKNADFYGAGAYSAPFDDSTLSDINSWVKDKTNGLIDNIIDNINPNTVMYLINAIAFEGKWEEPYKEHNISDGKFTTSNGVSQDVKMMYSKEGGYIQSPNALIFNKPYSGNRFSFRAILPNEDIGVDKYLEMMPNEEFEFAFARGLDDAEVVTYIPKFKQEYDVSLLEVLKSMGVKKAFDDILADFSAMGSSSRGNLYIGEVKHKTYIDVDENGTKAGAVTNVDMRDKCAAPEMTEPMTIRLDRPFIYMIYENETGLPLFIGVVNSIN